MKYLVLYILLMSASMAQAQQTHSQNYIISRTYKQAGANENDISKVNIQLQYIDGLGRPSQAVSVGQSPDGKDMVTHIEYDAHGRQAKQFLPFTAAGNGAFQTAGASATTSWYGNNSAGLQANDLGRPFSETTFESSPLNRPSSIRAPGNKSNSANIQYLANAANEVKRYDHNGATIVQNGYYAAGSLYRTRISDENSKVSNEYTDLQGRVVCKTMEESGGLATYYVYDDYGLLRAVLQPNYQADGSLANSAFLYDYDDQARMIKKQVPGGGASEIVYDQYDRPVYTRDANQLARGVWAFTKYDALNRPIVTGEIGSAANRATLAGTIDSGSQHHENRSNGVTAGYTLNLTAPTSATEANLLTITFYDDFGFQKPSGFDYSAGYYGSANTAVKGQVTGGRVRMLPGNGGTGAWLTSVAYYDAEYRPIQTVRELYDLGANASERVSTQYKYDLAPVISEQKTVQVVSGTTHSLVSTYLYDHADRLLSVKETAIMGSKTKTAYTLAQRYNTLGQLNSKWFHAYANDATKFRRRTDFTYNIRSWLTDAQTKYQQTQGTDLPFFSIGLDYANGGNYTNGNISQMQWSGKDETSFTKGLSFNYDGANRLTDSFGLGGYADTENEIKYDLNGNIKSLIRAGAAVDNLGYTYSGNRLTSINDASANNAGVKSGASAYAYDGNGNMISDGNRGATLTYNYLNLPKSVAIGGKTFTYDYDAGGTKHQYVADTLTVKYAGAFEYNENNIFKRLSIRDGQAIIRQDSIRFDYYLKDHLGNVRLVFDEKGDILQQTDYYPFGLSIDRNSPLTTPAARNSINRYLYNEKELQVGTGYLDYGARMYMPEIGRWGVVDPLADKMPSWSPYSYGFNNPIRFVDPIGLAPSTHTDEEGNVLAVYNDGDMGVYKHGNNADGDAPTKSNIDQRHEQSTSAGGERMGETAHWDEFITPGTNRAEGTIHFGENQSWDPLVKWGNDRANNQDLTITMKESKLNQVLDIKNNKDWASEGPMTGRLLNGKYATARSAGNYLAGMNGVTGKFQGSHISGDTYMKLAGAYQVGQLSMANILRIITYGASFGPAPYYGEEPYSGRRILEGINAGNKLLKK